MPKQKNQHYVPRCLLKNFTDKNGKFFIFRLLQNKILDIKIPYYDQCKTEYFYGSDGIIENKLKKFEDRVSNVFNKIISNTALNTYEELCLKQFVLLQYFRTEHMVDKRLYLMLESLNKILPTVLIQKGVKFSKEEIDSYIRTYIGKLSRSDTVQDSVHLALESINHLDDLALEIIHTKNNIVISDHPVIMLNFFQPSYGHGIDCAGLILLLPISSNYLCILYDEGIYNIKHENPDCIVDSFNKIQYIQARESLYSNTLETLQNIKDFFDQSKLYFDQQVALESEKFIPKNNIQKLEITLDIFELKSEFLPYKNNINACFSRFCDPNNIPVKYKFVSNEYSKLIIKYLLRRTR